MTGVLERTDRELGGVLRRPLTVVRSHLDVGVAKESRHGGQVGAGTDESGCECMSEDVRSESWEACGIGALAELRVERGRREGEDARASAVTCRAATVPLGAKCVAALKTSSSLGPVGAPNAPSVIRPASAAAPKLLVALPRKPSTFGSSA